MKRNRKKGRRTEDLRKLAEDKIRACGACMPGHAFDDVDELLSKLRLTKSERSRLSKNLYCPNCELYLEPNNSIVFYTEEEEKDIRRKTSWDKRYRPQFDNFQDFLVKHPSLGGLHTIGGQLARAIRRATARTLEPNIWYRARVYNKNQQLTADDFFPPTPQRHKVSVGRYNNAGQRAYYLGDSLKTVAVETLRDKKADDGKLWIAGVKILEPLRVLDLRFQILGEGQQHPLLLYGLLYAGKFNEVQKPSDLSDPQYRITQYIADLVRWRKLDGILYTSTQEYPFSYRGFGQNLVIVSPRNESFRVMDDYSLYNWARTMGTGPFDFPEMTLEKIQFPYSHT
jgi:hypothetical protein